MVRAILSYYGPELNWNQYDQRNNVTRTGLESGSLQTSSGALYVKFMAHIFFLFFLYDLQPGFLPWLCDQPLQSAYPYHV